MCCCIHPSAKATALLAYGARFTAVSPKGKREIAIEDFFVAPTADPTRVLGGGTPRRRGDHRNGHPPAPVTKGPLGLQEAQEKESFDWPLVETCVALALGEKRSRDARIVLGSVSPTPLALKRRRGLNGEAPGPDWPPGVGSCGPRRNALSQNAYKVRPRVMLERTLREALNPSGTPRQRNPLREREAVRRGLGRPDAALREKNRSKTGRRAGSLPSATHMRTKTWYVPTPTPSAIFPFLIDRQYGA